MALREEVESPERSIVGAKQERWLFDGLADAAPRWHTIAHQVALGNYMREGRRGAVVR
jgi:alkaline phosphatase D